MLRVLLASIAIVGSAAANTIVTPYLSLSGGAGGLAKGDVNLNGVEGEFEYDVGYSAEFAFGVKLDKGTGIFPARFEVAASQQSNDLKEFDITGSSPMPLDGQVDLLALTANAYLDILTGSFVTPYLMVGIGGASVDFEGDRSNIGLFQLGVGTGFELSDHWIIDLKLKAFTNMGKFDYSQDGVDATADISGSQAQIGLRYMF